MERTDKIKAGGYISKITFNNGETLEIAPNDIIILVGPNNAGKSQSLKDIYALSQGKCPTTVISDIETTKYSGSIIELLNKISKGNHQNRFIQYQVLGSHINVDEHTENVFLSSQYYGNLRTLFVADLDTSARLSI